MQFEKWWSRISMQQPITQIQMKNQFGLERNIPSAVKREVRRRAGFGCVVCGTAVIQYEHVAPEFSQARAHSPDGITALCGGCHDRVTRNFLSKSRIRAAMDKPACLASGYSRLELDAGMGPPHIRFGGMEFTNCPIPIALGPHAIPLIGVEAPEEAGAPYALSATFFDAQGNIVAMIRCNEWQCRSDLYDVRAEGGTITVYTATREIALRVRSLPGEGVAIERLSMLIRGRLVEGNEHMLRIHNGTGGYTDHIGGGSDHCQIGMML